MKLHIKLLTLLLVALVLVQSSVIPSLALSPVEIDTGIYEATGQPTTYSKNYNSGQRDVVATTLSGTSAAAYYTGSYAYEVLSTQSASAIQSALNTLMKSTHKKISSYDDCHYKADMTDCENENGKVSLIYTSYSATMSQWNGWNREHVWPKSLGGDTTSGGGADMHHIRPSDAVVNSTRGNKKYGYANGGKAVYGSNPASGVLGGYYGTYFEPLDNVKGDVARICLYVWIRWGSEWNATNVTKVFQSVDVLLEWCELDPVDTWELGRNEVVQAYQGNRNVFIDYPEYAWLVFGKEIPSDMVTPSGNAQTNVHYWDNGTVTKEPTCNATGTKTYTCSDCGDTKTEEIAALGHVWSTATVTTPATCTTSGVKTQTCSRCSITTTITISATGHSYTQGFCSSCGQRDPNSKAPTSLDFRNAVDNITSESLSGKERFVAISYAINVYNNLYDVDKEAVEDKYQELLTIVDNYNNDVQAWNDEANKISENIVGIAIASSSAFVLALYSLLSKKFF